MESLSSFPAASLRLVWASSSCCNLLGEGLASSNAVGVNSKFPSGLDMFLLVLGERAEFNGNYEGLPIYFIR